MKDFHNIVEAFLYLQTDKITDFIIQYPYILFLRCVS